MGSSGEWSVYATYGTESGEGDRRKVEYIYGAWTISISHGHGMRPGKVIRAATDEWQQKGAITAEKATSIRSGHQGGRAFNPDITAYGISEQEVSAAILEDLFDTMDIDGTAGPGATPARGERPIRTNGVEIKYRYAIDAGRNFVGVGTYFLERA